MRMFVLSRRVNDATFFESSAIAFIAALSRELASAIFFEAFPISVLDGGLVNRSSCTPSNRRDLLDRKFSIQYCQSELVPLSVAIVRSCVLERRQ